jgi:ribosomal protein L11 methyltransferase
MNILINPNVSFWYAGLFQSSGQWIHPQKAEQTYEIIYVTEGEVYMCEEGPEGERQIHAKAGELVLEIDPGTAFGTGTHETTSLCMKLMEKYAADCGGAAAASGSVGTSVAADGVRVIDVGCGSGILSIAAALVGCKYVLGTEIDSDAVQIAKENVALNGVAAQVKVLEADLLKGIPYKADMIVANLMHNLVMQLAPDAYTHLDAGGVFISSGILLEKRDQVASAVEAAGFEILEIPEDGEWCAIAAQKK